MQLFTCNPHMQKRIVSTMPQEYLIKKCTLSCKTYSKTILDHWPRLPEKQMLYTIISILKSCRQLQSKVFWPLQMPCFKMSLTMVLQVFKILTCFRSWFVEDGQTWITTLQNYEQFMFLSCFCCWMKGDLPRKMLNVLIKMYAILHVAPAVLWCNQNLKKLNYLNIVLFW